MSSALACRSRLTNLLASGTNYERKADSRIQSPGSKKILALDGGGIRGMVTVEVLAEIESQLRQKTGRENAFQLADYFDFKMAPCSNRSLRYSDN